MKNTKKFGSIILALTFLIVFLTLGFSTARAVPVDNASLTIDETRISTSGLAAVPDIYGDKIVWQDNRSGKWDIYMYNLSTKKETRITTSGSATSPAIDGNRIVWIDGRNGENLNFSDPNAGGHDIYMCDLLTKKETRITKSTIPADGFGYTLGVAISGNRIIWGGTYYYRIYDIFTRKIKDSLPVGITSNKPGTCVNPKKRLFGLLKPIENHMWSKWELFKDSVTYSSLENQKAGLISEKFQIYRRECLLCGKPEILTQRIL